MPNQFLPIGQAAEYLSVSIDTLRRWEKSRKISSTRLDGKNRYFKIADLDKLIQMRKHAHGNQAINMREHDRRNGHGGR